MNGFRPLAELQALFRSSPAFRQVFLADLSNQFGDGGLIVAFPMLILASTHDVALTGLAFSGEILAFALVSPFSGVLADRLEQKTVMIASVVVRIALMGLLLATVLWRAPVALMFALSVAIGAVGAFFVPARAAFLVRLLEGEELERAIALEWTAGFLMRLISPPLMGVLLAFAPAATGLVVDMAAYSVGILLLLPRYVRPVLTAAVAPQAEPAGGFMEGFRVVGRSGELRGLLALDATISLLCMAGFSSTVAFLEQELHVGAHANGWLLAATGLAGALGSQLARPLGRLPGVYVGLAAAIGLTYVLVPHAASLPAMMAMWALRGMAVGTFGVLLSQRIALTVPKDVMGRVNAAWILAACLAAFAGTAVTPLLLRTLGAAGSFHLYGVLMLAAAATMLAARALRHRPKPADPLEPVAEA